MEWSGSVNTTGLPSPGSFGATPGNTRAQFNLWSANGDATAGTFYSVSGSSYNFSFHNPATSFWNINGVGSGPTVGIQFNISTAGFITLPFNYLSGTDISGFLVLQNTSFASLGVIDGITSSVSWNTGAGLQEMTFQTDRNAFAQTPAPVPAPAPLLLTLAGLTGLAWQNRRAASAS